MWGLQLRGPHWIRRAQRRGKKSRGQAAATPFAQHFRVACVMDTAATTECTRPSVVQKQQQRQQQQQQQRRDEMLRQQQ
jgi:hypothetical protein